MKKKMVSLLMTATLATAMLAGCGSKEAAVTSTEENTAGEVSSDDAIAALIANTEGTVELTVWCDESEEYQNVMAEIVDEFKAAYPDVDFNITIGAESAANCKDDVLVDPEAAADLFVFADDQLEGLVKAGALQPISNTYTYDPAETNAASTVEAASIGGQLYAYPMTASNGYFLFYNKNLLTEEDVASWDNLLAACEAQGKTVGMEVSGAWYLYSFFAGAGLEMYGNEDGTNTCNWNATDTAITGAQVAEAVTAICKNKAMVNCVNEDAQAFALNGEMIADVNGTWATNAFVEAYGDGYAATKLPTFTVDGKQVQMGSFAGYKFLGVNSYSKNVGWAMLLGEFITSEASQAAIGSATGEGPANLNAAASDEIASLPALAALAQQSEYASLQRVGNAYWGPAATLGQSLVEGTYTDAQELLDVAVEGITQPVAQ